MPVRYILSCMWVRLSIFSQLSIIQYMGLCVFNLTISLVMIERIYNLFIIIIKSELWAIIHCLWLGHETLVCRQDPGGCWLHELCYLGELIVIGLRPNSMIYCIVSPQMSILQLTHWGRDKMAATSQTTFSNAFSWVKMYEFGLKLHWSLFLGVQLTIFHHWVR